MVEYKCDKCKKIFSQKIHYTNHINRKNPCDEIDPICQYCDKKFCRKSYLKTHIIKCKIKMKEKIIINNEKKFSKIYIDDIKNKSVDYKKNESIDNNDNIKKKKKIPKIIKNLVWDTYIGQENGIGKCYVCDRKIDAKDFECGHIIAESKGGNTSIDNLRPICRCCNGSVGSMNMDDFKKIYFNIVNDIIKSK
jgi:hypothetical protein